LRDFPATGVCVERLEDVETISKVGGNVHDGTRVVQVVVLHQIRLAYTLEPMRKVLYYSR
jgi:hypothetical protein